MRNINLEINVTSFTYTNSKKFLYMNYILFPWFNTLEVKSSDFHFLKKEYPFACATVQLDWIFLNSAWYKNALNTPGVIYRFFAE